MLRSAALAAGLVASFAVNHTFLVWGDYGTGNCAKYKCDFMLTLGDNFYDGPNTTSDPRFSTQFSEMYTTKVPFYICAGNHDYKGKLDAELGFSADSRWTFPSLNYTHVFADLDLTVVYLDTSRSQPSYMESPFGDCNGLCAEQLKEVGCTTKTATACWQEHLDWLDQTLKAATTKWKFVLGHHPIDDGNMPATAPVLSSNGVQAYLAGHVHNLQHATSGAVNYFISGAGAFVKPGVEAVTRDGTLVLPPSRGRTLSCPEGSPCAPLVSNFTADGPGFLSFEADTDASTMTARFYQYTGTEGKHRGWGRGCHDRPYV